MSKWFDRLQPGLLLGFSLSFGPLAEAGVVADPPGDAFGNADAVSISGRFAQGNLYVDATFSDGTLNPTNLGFIFGFDTDRNLTTGVQPPATFPLGSEVSVYFNSASSPDALLYSQFLVQLIRVTFGTNSLSLVLPLSSLGTPFGPADGVMGFGFIVGVPNGTNGFFGYDIVPNSADGGPLTGLTSPIPELKIRREGNTNVVSWDARATDFVLQSASTLSASAVWIDTTNVVAITGIEAAIHDTDPAPMKFYRMGYWE